VHGVVARGKARHAVLRLEIRLPEQEDIRRIIQRILQDGRTAARGTDDEEVAFRCGLA
jgi:hypothetical protein